MAGRSICYIETVGITEEEVLLFRIIGGDIIGRHAIGAEAARHGRHDDAIRHFDGSECGGLEECCAHVEFRISEHECVDRARPAACDSGIRRWVRVPPLPARQRRADLPRIPPTTETIHEMLPRRVRGPASASCCRSRMTSRNASLDGTT